MKQDRTRREKPKQNKTRALNESASMYLTDIRVNYTCMTIRLKW